MKTLLLIVVIIANAFIAAAQFAEPGQKLIGGTISFNTGDIIAVNPGDEFKSTGISASINAGKFIKKNILNAFSIFYGNGWSKQIMGNNMNKNTTNAVYASFGKTYFKP